MYKANSISEISQLFFKEKKVVCERNVRSDGEYGTKVWVGG